ncbi:MAG: T9SS type A sorting domain-containing protein [Bacteroidales bacterium]|nr:T9SS type A sorting domain-containing protein [Bacteroidales bacterium]
MKKLYLFFLMALGMLSGAVANASDYKTMIRYDRVWESITGEWGPYTAKYMKFDGSEEFLGKTYHRIVTFKKSVVDIAYPIEDSTYEFFDDVYEHEGYLREEDGKVYTLIMETISDDYLTGALYIPTETYQDGLTLAERLIYDFSWNEGDIYSALTFTTRLGELHDLKTRHKSTIMVDDEECTMIGVCPTYVDDEIDFYYTLIEGIGPVDHGCLNYTEFYAHLTRPWEYNYFNRVFDSNGKVLYRNPEFCPELRLPDNLFSSVGIVTDSGNLSITADGVAFGYDNRRNKVCIYDLEGRLVASESGAGRMTIPTSHLTPGMYIAEGRAEGCAATRRKFIVR